MLGFFSCVAERNLLQNGACARGVSSTASWRRYFRFRLKPSYCFNALEQLDKLAFKGLPLRRCRRTAKAAMTQRANERQLLSKVLTTNRLESDSMLPEPRQVSVEPAVSVCHVVPRLTKLKGTAVRMWETVPTRTKQNLLLLLL